MPHGNRARVFALAVMLMTALTGCFHQTPSESLPRLQCEYRFDEIPPEDRERVDRLIRYASYGDPVKKGTDAKPIYQFEAKSYEALDRMHALLVHKPFGFPETYKGERRTRRVYSSSRPKLTIKYSDASIDAGIDIRVTFDVTPGASVYYKPEGQPEQDVTKFVGKRGKASVPVSIQPGQKFIYCRIDHRGVEKFVRIDVYTQEVVEIRSSEYPR